MRMHAAAALPPRINPAKVPVGPQAPQDEYRRLTGTIGFKECGGGV